MRRSNHEAAIATHSLRLGIGNDHPRLELGLDGGAQFRNVEVHFDDIDDTAMVWNLLKTSWEPTDCNIDAGPYPRAGRCTLRPQPGYAGGWVPFVMRFGNGGGGSSGHARIVIDDRLVWERRTWSGFRGYGWFFKEQFFVDLWGAAFFPPPP